MEFTYTIENRPVESSHDTPTHSESEIQSSDVSMMSSDENPGISLDPETSTILPPVFHTTTDWAEGIFDVRSPEKCPLVLNQVFSSYTS
jgi:hypothetical protein